MKYPFCVVRPPKKTKNQKRQRFSTNKKKKEGKLTDKFALFKYLINICAGDKNIQINCLRELCHNLENHSITL